MTARRFPLPKRFNVAMSDKAYAVLRELNSRYGYGNNYLLTVLLENLDSIARKGAIDKVFSEFESQFGAPAPGSMKRKK